MTKIENTGMSFDEISRNWKTLYQPTGGNVKWCSHFWKAAQFHKIKLQQDPKIIFLEKYLREMKKMCLHKNLYKC